MIALRAGSLDPTRAAELTEDVAQEQRRVAEHGGIFFEWIEIEDADVRTVNVRSARRPHVRCYTILIGEPEQSACVIDERIVHDAIFLGNGNRLEPRRAFGN